MAPETVPDTWDSARDERFFRITARVLPRAAVEAASSLLASYDDSSGLLGAASVANRVPAQVPGDWA